MKEKIKRVFFEMRKKVLVYTMLVIDWMSKNNLLTIDTTFRWTVRLFCKLVEGYQTHPEWMPVNEEIETKMVELNNELHELTKGAA